MEFHGLLGVRRTIYSFNNKAVEVYFLNFGVSVLAFVPEFALSFGGRGETDAMNGIIALTKNLGMVEQEASVKEIESNERTGTRKASKAGGSDPESTLF